MTEILHARSPGDDTRKDPNDYRDDPFFKNRFEDLLRQPQADLDWTKSFVMTDHEAQSISDPEWIVPNLVIQGHVIVIPAEPNGGKTTIFIHLAGEMAGSGYRVFYVNADISGGDAKAMLEHSKANSYTLMLPDMKVGLSMNDVVARLIDMNQQGGDFGGVVFILDTLKKMTSVINKGEAKELYKTLRGLSAKGMTIILLAHTNKYTGEDGFPIYEGTGDLRSDVDELIYFLPRKNANGGMTVSTHPDKVRGRFQPITFEIAPDRTVTRVDSHVDVIAERTADQRLEQDHASIEAITEALKAGKIKHVQIIDHCREHHQIGRRIVERVLIRYREPPTRLWRREKGFQHNAWFYHLEPEKCSP